MNSNDDAQIEVLVKRSGYPDKMVTLTMDTKQQAEYALLGYWRETANRDRTGVVLDFFPSAEYPLKYKKTGRICRSFLPYIGLLPHTQRKDSKNVYDFRVSSFINADKRKCNLMDFIPRMDVPTKSKVKPIAKSNVNPDQSSIPFDATDEPLIEPVVIVSDQTLPPVSIPVPESIADINIARATLITIMNLFKCDAQCAVSYIMDNKIGK